MKDFLFICLFIILISVKYGLSKVQYSDSYIAVYDGPVDEKNFKKLEEYGYVLDMQVMLSLNSDIAANAVEITTSNFARFSITGQNSYNIFFSILKLIFIPKIKNCFCLFLHNLNYARKTLN